MKLDDTVMVQFFGELIESYRQQIMDQEEARELSKKEKKFLADLRKELGIVFCLKIIWDTSSVGRAPDF